MMMKNKLVPSCLAFALCLLFSAVATAGEVVEWTESPQQTALFDAVTKYKTDLDKTKKNFDKWDVGKAFGKVWKDMRIEPVVFHVMKIGKPETTNTMGRTKSYKGTSETYDWTEKHVFVQVTCHSRFGRKIFNITLERMKQRNDTKQVIEQEALPADLAKQLKLGEQGGMYLLAVLALDDMSGTNFGKAIQLGVGDAEPFSKGKIAGKLEFSKIMDGQSLAGYIEKLETIRKEKEAAEAARALLIEKSQPLHAELIKSESPDQGDYYKEVLAYDALARDKTKRDETDAAAKAIKAKWAGRTLKGFNLVITEVGPIQEKRSGSITFKNGERTNFANVNEIAELEGKTSFGPIKMKLVFREFQTKTSDGTVTKNNKRHEALRNVYESLKPGDRLVMDWALGDQGDFKWSKPVASREVVFDDDRQGNDDYGTWMNLKVVKADAIDGP